MKVEARLIQSGEQDTFMSNLKELRNIRGKERSQSKGRKEQFSNVLSSVSSRGKASEVKIIKHYLDRENRDNPDSSGQREVEVKSIELLTSHVSKVVAKKAG